MISALYALRRVAALLSASVVLPLCGGVGDPQLRTDHPFYPGELACSTFERLFASQAAQYEHVTGVLPTNDHHRALASWFWRNTHYAHGEEGAENLWSTGFKGKGDLRTREYWTGLFSHGFGLCGTTHSQWTAEMEYLLGHGRARGAGVVGHNAFEVFLTGEEYGAGRWALLDHDISTVIFNPAGKRLLSIHEVQANLKQLTSRAYHPEKQNGWLVSGLHASDASAYSQFTTAEYLPGYAAAPPMVHLRRGETLRRYLQPGLEDGRTFVFWGRNYSAGNIPGPERSLTWVNQPEKMHRSKHGTEHHTGQARYGNAVYTYMPSFVDGAYREAVVSETDASVTFEFYTPYMIAATPPNSADWGIYDRGCSNGLVVTGRGGCPVAVSVDRGRTWSTARPLTDRLDFTDDVKGHRQYFMRFDASPGNLEKAGVTIRTVCQANPAVLPRLKDSRTEVSFLASGAAVVSAGPTIAQAAAHIVEGAFNSPSVTLELEPPRGAAIARLYAAAHVASGNPPSPEVKYQIEYATAAGAWQPLAKDWSVPRRDDEPPDFWSQSFCYGSIAPKNLGGKVRVRFRNNGGKKYMRAEAHLVYRLAKNENTKVTFDWTDHSGPHRASHTFAPLELQRWSIPTGVNVQTRWVDFSL